ncbi:MAG: hypothetical protein M0036_09930 [Desulfobacteraceae bacterium]|nr:hypothetical protein [Desulfobacteraceae bacterium]
MTTREKIIVGVMCLTIAYGAYDLMGPRASKKPNAKPESNTMEEQRKFAAEVTQKMASGKLSQAYQYLVQQAGADWTKDPFIPSTQPLKQQAPSAQSAEKKDQESKKPMFVFTGFLQLGETKIAVINGVEYAVGDSLGVDGYYLRSVSADKVVIGRTDGSETIHLTLNEFE